MERDAGGMQCFYLVFEGEVPWAARLHIIQLCTQLLMHPWLIKHQSLAVGLMLS